MNRPFVHHSKVLFSINGQIKPVNEMTDKHYSICKAYVNKMKLDPRYKGGKLLVVSMLDKQYKTV